MRKSDRPSVACLGLLLVAGGILCVGSQAQAQSRGSLNTGAAQEQQIGQDAVLDPVNDKTILYRSDADAGKEIAAALMRATAEKKRVLLAFGGNWCYDCHVLDRALHAGAAGRVARQSFLIVHVDIGEGEKNPELVRRYKVPLAKGVPAVVILDGAGKMIYSSANGEFEAARRMMKKDLLAFLNHWKVRVQR